MRFSAQLAAGASVPTAVGQVDEDRMKSPELLPLTMMPLRFSVAVPVLVKVTSAALLLVPTSWGENARFGEESDTAGAAAPVPDSITV